MRKQPLVVTDDIIQGSSDAVSCMLIVIATLCRSTALMTCSNSLSNLIYASMLTDYNSLDIDIRDTLCPYRLGTCKSFFFRLFRSNRISNRIGRPIRFRIESSNRIGRMPRKP